MKTLVTLAVAATALAAAAASPAQAQTSADSAGVRAAALDYIQGWYTGDAARMERALHPDLVKRIVRRDTDPDRVMEMSAEELVSNTARGGGSNAPEESRRDDVTILDIFRETAAVRIDAGDWVDYLQVAKIDGEWKIVNVLWELRAPQR